jgi:hypothetical protein
MNIDNATVRVLSERQWLTNFYKPHAHDIKFLIKAMDAPLAVGMPHNPENSEDVSFNMYGLYQTRETPKDLSAFWVEYGKIVGPKELP